MLEWCVILAVNGQPRTHVLTMRSQCRSLDRLTGPQHQLVGTRFRVQDVDEDLFPSFLPNDDVAGHWACKLGHDHLCLGEGSRSPE